jgi:predicted HAD superfamily phosphohydrolase YqeG
MRARYLRATTTTEVWQCLDRLKANTVVLDVEPLVAFWDTDQTTLQEGVSAVLDRLVGAGAATIVFATNSARTALTTATPPGAHVIYLASASKPLRVAAYRGLLSPGVVVGDQVATDGVLAWRLGYTFLHYAPDLPDTPRGPRLMGLIGRPIRRVLFGDP